MKKLLACLNDLSTASNEKNVNEHSNYLYLLLTNTKITKNEFIEIVAPKICLLLYQNRIKKDLLYLSLLTNSDSSILQNFIETEKSSHILDVNSKVSIINHCLFKQSHWFQEVLFNSITNKEHLLKENCEIVNVLRLFKASNEELINFHELQIFLDIVNKDSEFIQFYIKQLGLFLNIVKFCKKQLNCHDPELTHIFYFLNNNSLLSTFSKFLDLQSPIICKDIQLLLEQCHLEDIASFTAYVILFNILTAIQLCKAISKDSNVKSKDEISEIVKNTECELVQLTNSNLQVELLENIFALLFMKREDFSLIKTNLDFCCSEREVRLILLFLKSTCDEIKRRNLYDKTSEAFRRFTQLNKNLADGLWRLELILDFDENYGNRKIEKNIVSYMLAPPESLIHLCLKRNNFNKAHQVIQIFNLQDSYICLEINYNIKLQQFRQSLKKLLKKPIKNICATVDEYFSSNTIIENEYYGDVINFNIQTHKFITHFSVENSNFMNMLDLAITLPDNFENCEELMNIAVTYNTADPNIESFYSNFCKGMLDIFNEVNNRHSLPIRDILCNPAFNLNKEQYRNFEEFYGELCKLCGIFIEQANEVAQGKLNNKHISHKLFLKLHQLFMRLCANTDVKEGIKYLQRLFNYLRGVSKLYYIERNNSDLISKGCDTSYFAILNHGKSNILEHLLFERKLDVSDFEQLFIKLKLDLVYHIAAIFFPKSDENIGTDKLKPNNNIISYIHKRNWLLAFVLSEMYKMEETKLDLNEIRIKTFVNLVKLDRIKQLKCLFGNNEVSAALYHYVNVAFMKTYFDQHIIKQDMDEGGLLTILNSQSSLDTAEEMFEGDLKITDWKHLYDIISSIPASQLYTTRELLELHDVVLDELVSDCFEPDYYKYVQFITNARLRRECILNNFTNWPGIFCIEVLKSELSGFDDLNDADISLFSMWLKSVQFYENVKLLLQVASWYDALLLCKEDLDEVLLKLLTIVDVDLLLNFITIHNIPSDNLLAVDVTYFTGLVHANVPLTKISNLLEHIPETQVIDICYNLLKILKKLEHMEFIVNFISKSSFAESSIFKNIQMGLKMLSCFSTTEQEQLWCLISDPLSIIEIPIMNTKLDKLGQVLEKIKIDLQHCEFDENMISVEKIDEILRAYAEKSLEFRVILQPEPRSLKASETSKLLQSIDSINLISNQKYFIMPERVPDKNEWVENYEVTECMCCLESTFSMFNRRHHCRRCGRVICGSCSLKRMQVQTYGNILVRVCLDCYEQSHPNVTGASSLKSETSTKSIGCDYWLLTDDPNHNQIVHEEFSYEYAPSVSLCLAILKHHSKNEDYPKFLLDQCNGMLHLLQPVNSEALQEIDYLLVIKMLKSLAIAAKMVSAQCMLQWGSSLADRILSQADLLGLLAERGCLHLIPNATQGHSRYIDAPTLRRLRDKLLEREQWNLALEVSTKAGLDNTGVFAAWGKSYLKAGCLQLAREKFQRCFDKTTHYDASVELSDSFSTLHNPQFLSTLHMLPENRPTKNPPILNEIIQILESNTCVFNSKILSNAKNAKNLMGSSMCSLNSSLNIAFHNDHAICILNKLKNLSSIAAGNYCNQPDTGGSSKSLNILTPYIEPILYQECVYYLSKYGTHMSLLEFYIKHNDLHNSLNYMLDNRLRPDVFIEIYMLCLKNDQVCTLLETMSEIDSTLDVWKDYLKHICRHLEKQEHLHSLYQLQQFMGDFVRAAMTCIKFYRDDSTTYLELTTKSEYLNKAQEHLQQELEQEQWVEVASVRKSSADTQESFEAKGIANPSLVMKMDSKDVDKHINTIWRQIEVTKFLADCEASGTPVLTILPEILPFINEDLPSDEVHKVKIPTLFGSYYERVQLTVLAIICGANVEDGFDIAFRIIQEYKLNPVKVYCQAGKQLAKTERYIGIAQLVNCIRSSGINDSAITNMCDEMLTLAVQTLTKVNATGPQLDGLIKLITDRAARISAYIEAKQLKSAYLLAVKHKRMGDIRRILREAELLNQPSIKALCQKILHAHSHSKD